MKKLCLILMFLSGYYLNSQVIPNLNIDSLGSHIKITEIHEGDTIIFNLIKIKEKDGLAYVYEVNHEYRSIIKGEYSYSLEKESGEIRSNYIGRKHLTPVYQLISLIEEKKSVLSNIFIKSNYDFSSNYSVDTSTGNVKYEHIVDKRKDFGLYSIELIEWNYKDNDKVVYENKHLIDGELSEDLSNIFIYEKLENQSIINELKGYYISYKNKLE